VLFIGAVLRSIVEAVTNLSGQIGSVEEKVKKGEDFGD
jgi:hypothetical protein